MDSTEALPSNLIEAWERAVREFPSRGLGMLDSQGREKEHRSYPTLWAAIRASAARLDALGVRPGEPLPICLPTSWEFFEIWFGAVLVGALPVALPPPGAMGSSAYQLSKLEKIVAMLKAPRMICRGNFKSEAQELGSEELARLAISVEEHAAAAPSAAFSPPRPEPDAIAFLQLTSGSTGTSRAVMIRHRSAVANPLAIDEAIGAAHEVTGAPRARDAGVSGVTWLPLYHDMGLVGCLLYCLLAGIDLWFLTPKAFMGRPQSWLKALARYPRSFSPAPNFAYQTCLERVPPEKLAGLDLRSWCAAMIGAEMIRPETLRSFTEAYAPLGFDPRALRPCYGLAEGTLAVTFDQRGAGLRSRALPEGVEPGTGPAEIACVGAPVRGTRVRILAPDGSELGEERIGEVAIGGESLFAGYYLDEEATAACMSDGWLRTGDLGFLDDGELWLTGRIKDLIIINGQNIMPHEIEWLAEAVTGGGGSMRCCALSINRPGEGERPALVVEVGEVEGQPLSELERLIRIDVGRALGVPLLDVCFVRRGRIPKTTSGKVQRGETLRRYLRGELERIPVEIS